MKFGGEVYRWHHATRIWTGREFPRTFEDGPWKWKAQERYAGENLNCGHYFALSKSGAEAEARFYHRDLSEHRLLAVEVGLDSVLDLTHGENFQQVARELVENPEILSRLRMVSEFLDADRGGNLITDQVGYWASRSKYNGVLFFSAGSLNQFPDLHSDVRDGRDFITGVPIVDLVLDLMRRELSLPNLVVFSGSKLTTRIRRYSVYSGPYAENLYFDVATAALDKWLQYGSDYQDERFCEVILSGKCRLQTQEVMVRQIVRDAKPPNVRHLSGGRTAYWDERTRVVVITTPGSRDAVIYPRTGRAYFDGLR